MKHRKDKTQELASAKAGISERSARRIESGASVTLPSQIARRYRRARADPFEDVWESEVVPHVNFGLLSPAGDEPQRRPLVARQLRSESDRTS